VKRTAVGPNNPVDDGAQLKAHQTVIGIMIFPPCRRNVFLSAMHLP
jgi:hypothetical protein